MNEQKNGLVVTKQQFTEKMLKDSAFPDSQEYAEVYEQCYYDIIRNGFLLLDKKALMGRLTSGNAKAEIMNKLIKEILEGAEK